MKKHILSLVLCSAAVAGYTQMTVPFTQTFDGFAMCSPSGNCWSDICALSDGWDNPSWPTDDIDWNVHAGPIDLSGLPQAPFEDHTTGTAAGQYMVIGEAGDCFDQEAFLLSPTIDLSGTTQPSLSFWFHYFDEFAGFEESMPQLHLDIWTQSSGTWTSDIMPVIDHDYGNVWNEQVVDLSAYVGEVVQFRWRGRTGEFAFVNLGIDDVSVFDAGPPVDDCDCAADLNNDGEIGTADLLDLLSLFGTSCP